MDERSQVARLWKQAGVIAILICYEFAGDVRKEILYTT